MKQFFLLLLGGIFLSACTSDEDEAISAGRYGMMSTETPQYAAVIFVRSIYNDKTLDRAINNSTEHFGKIIRNHHTPKNVQRHVLNLRLDSMNVEPMAGGTLIYSDQIKEAEVEVKITGEFNREPKVDLKTISMVRESGKWLVSDVRNTIP
uniref:hypothetical protein n=1 Tax=Ningiella ruwaisensis TaxID=2364274 RepID=UPI00109F3DD1|nr:hypothetical protein [Ningiella ruwaisensis]